jgi:hypothetical protein
LIDLPAARQIEVAWPESKTEPRVDDEDEDALLDDEYVDDEEDAEEPPAAPAHGEYCPCSDCVKKYVDSKIAGAMATAPAASTLTPDCKHGEHEWCSYCIPF